MKYTWSDFSEFVSIKTKWLKRTDEFQKKLENSRAEIEHGPF